MTNHTPAPWRWENGEYDCGFPCTPDGCKGHDNGVPEYLAPVGMWVPEPPNDTEKWVADAAIIKAAPDLLSSLQALLTIPEILEVLPQATLNDAKEAVTRATL